MSDPSVTPNPSQITTPGNDTNQVLIALSSGLVAGAKLSVNIAPQIIVITEDKIHLCLRDHIDRMGRRHDWLAPGGIVITLVLTLLTTTFHDTFGLSAATWEAICIVSLGPLLFWLYRTLRAMPHAVSIADIVNELREESKRNIGS